MKQLLSAAGSVAFCTTLVAQATTGAIAGKVTDPSGAAATPSTILATNTITHTVHKGSVSARGEYTVAGLPAGTYDLSVPVTAGVFSEARYTAFLQKDLTVEAGRTTPFDIGLKLSLGPLGDAPVALLNGMRARATLPTGPSPRMPDGRPDFSGFWLNTTAGQSQFDGGAAVVMPLLPWAQQAQQERQKKGTFSSLSLCLPAGPIPILPDFPYQFVQNSTMLVMLQDLNFPGWRQIFLDGRPHPALWNPSWFGHSVGTWEGDTLVVDTVGFNDESVLNGAPHTEQLHVIERYTRPDAGHLEIDIVAEDPGAFSTPWKRHLSATLGAKDEEIMEYLCENNVAPRHMQTVR